MKILGTILILFFSLNIFAATTDNEEQQFAELNGCELAVGYQSGQPDKPAQYHNQVYCIKDTAQANCGFLIFNSDSKTFADKPEGTVPVACANGGFKKLLSQKIGDNKTVRDALYDGFGAPGAKPVVIKKSTLPMVLNFVKVYSDFHEDGAGLQPVQKTAGKN